MSDSCTFYFKEDDCVYSPTPVVDVSSIDYDQYQHLIFQEEARHHKELQGLRARNREYQKTCPHKTDWVRYVPDASGNNDSYNECRKCGKQW